MLPARVTEGCLSLIKHQSVQGSSGLDVPGTQFFPFPALYITLPQCDLLELSLCLCLHLFLCFQWQEETFFPLKAAPGCSCSPACLQIRWKRTGSLGPGDAFQESNVHTPGITHCWKHSWNLESFDFSSLWIFPPVPSLSFCSAVPGVHFSPQ